MQLFLYIAVALSVPAIGWLVKTVIELKADLHALEKVHDGTKEETNRRFMELADSLRIINAKLDRLVERKLQQ